MKTTVARLFPAAAAIALSLTLVACSSAAAPSPVPTVSPPPASLAPSDPATSPSDPDTGVGSPTDPGGGIGGSGGLGDGGKLVIPHPGTVNPHPVSIEGIAVNVDGRHVTAKLTWTSGVEPCYVLDSVVVSRDANDFVLTVVEGTTDPNQACIEIAQTKATIVDLGDLEPGAYTIAATNSQIPPTTFTVS